MYKPYLIIAAILGALAVALGAFGAHGLKTKVNADTLQIFETGVKYQFWHVFALIVVALLYQAYPSATMLWSGKLFMAGIILFSGSLYALTFFRAGGNENMNWLGAVTPFGGLSFIIGWILLVLALWKGK